MSYGAGQFPVEYASKLGHIHVIEHDHVRRLLRQFESAEPAVGASVEYRTGTVDLNTPSDIRYIIAVDGGQAVIPNAIRQEKKLAFIKFSALLLERETIAYLRANPIVDPRNLATMLGDKVWYQAAALPLAGIRLPGETVKDTIRKTVDAVLEYTRLYDVLYFLVYRKWDPQFDMNPSTNPEAPHMNCLGCGADMYLRKDAHHFSCPACGYSHLLSDYLGITWDMADEFARGEVVANLRNALETLTLWHFISRQYRTNPRLLSRVLFIKDGPLLLRAQLGRLIEPIRDFISTMQKQGVPLYLVGTEKHGDVVQYSALLREHLKNPGDFFLPSVRHLMEEVSGVTYDPKTYRNRAQYGNKVVVRLGPDHLVPLDLPTGDFCTDPQPSDLIGFAEAVSVLSELTSYSHDNALIPIKLANEYSSISQRPSGDILKAFAGMLL